MHRWNFSARFALVLFLFALPILTSISTAWAETTITLFFTNSGGEVQSLQIIDNICNKNMFSGHFAGPYAKKIDGFCVRDASNSIAKTEEMSFWRNHDHGHRDTNGKHRVPERNDLWWRDGRWKLHTNSRSR